MQIVFLLYLFFLRQHIIFYCQFLKKRCLCGCLIKSHFALLSFFYRNKDVVVFIEVLLSKSGITFSVKSKIKCPNALEILTVSFDESALSRKNVYKWYKIFQEVLEHFNFPTPYSPWTSLQVKVKTLKLWVKLLWHISKSLF